MDILTEALRLAGSVVCHQLPARTIYADGMPLPVCARDTGIYLGVFTGFMFILLLGRFNCDKEPRIPYAVVLCLLMLPMMADGMGSYVGLFDTNNTTRLFTGVLFGIPLPVLLIPAANIKRGGPETGRVLRNVWELAGLIAAGVIVCLPVLYGLLPWLAPAAVVIASMIFIVGRVIFTIISLAGRAGDRFILLKTAGATACVLFVLYLISFYILQPLRDRLTG